MRFRNNKCKNVLFLDDHSRVILNELTNVSGSDYINASSIVSTQNLFYKKIININILKYIEIHIHLRE